MHPGAAAAVGEVGSCVVGSVQHPLGGQQAFDSYGSSGVNAGSTDSYFGTETETEAVGEPGAGVVEDAGAVHLLLEFNGLFSCKNKYLLKILFKRKILSARILQES